jgi:hypothetical protein
MKLNGPCSRPDMDESRRRLTSEDRNVTEHVLATAHD